MTSLWRVVINPTSPAWSIAATARAQRQRWPLTNAEVNGAFHRRPIELCPQICVVCVSYDRSKTSAQHRRSPAQYGTINLHHINGRNGNPCHDSAIHHPGDVGLITTRHKEVTNATQTWHSMTSKSRFQTYRNSSATPIRRRLRDLFRCQ